MFMRVTGCLFLLVLSCVAVPLQEAKTEVGNHPEQVVKELYAQHDKRETSLFVEPESQAALERFFTPELAELIWKNAELANGEVGAIDGDPLYDAQDMEIERFKISKVSADASTASVVATFENFGKKQKVQFSLQKEKQGWRISDILYSEGHTLEKLLKEALK